MKKTIIPYFVTLIIGIIIGFGIAKFSNDCTNNINLDNAIISNAESQNVDVEPNLLDNEKLSISELTKEKRVVDYIKEHQQLPDYYITKSEARKKGWDASEGNLCDVLPGRAIGGDYFSNREKQLPSKNGRQYFEADINYNCGNRNTDRLVFSNDGLIFVTYNHYNSFQQK